MPDDDNAPYCATDEKYTTGPDKQTRQHLLVLSGKVLASKRVKIIQGADGHELRLGSGAFGKVLKGFLDGIFTVALKELDYNECKLKKLLSEEDLRHSFGYEAARASSVEHPFVLEFYGAVIDGPRRFLVSPYCEGGTLEDFLASIAGPLAPCNQWRLLVEIASALEYLHAEGMLHKDLKSENILLSARDPQLCHVRLGDLGMSQVDSQLLASAHEKEPKEVQRGLKDMRWCSPEEASGQIVTAKSDVYAWGLIAYHVITGGVPWLNWSVKSVMRETAAGRVAHHNKVPSEHPLAPLILRCWSSSACDRPSAAELVRDLAGLASACFDSALEAAHAVRQLHVTVALHHSRHDRSRYVPSVVTGRQDVSRVPDDFPFSFLRSTQLVPEREENKTHSSTVSWHSDLCEVDETVKQFLLQDVSSAQLLVLIADGGRGKSLLLDRLACELHDVISIRLKLKPEEWSVAGLAGAAERCLKEGYGLAEDALDAMKRVPQVFLVDALDEVTLDQSWPENTTLMDLLGLQSWPLAKVIVTTRPDVIHNGLPQRLLQPSVESWRRYVLPFNATQTRYYLERHAAGHAQDQPSVDPVIPLELLQNPLVLRLYATCRPDVRQRVRVRSDIYAASVESWCERMKARLSSETLSALCGQARTFQDSVVKWAGAHAMSMFLNGSSSSPRGSNPWDSLKTLLTTEHEEQRKLITENSMKRLLLDTDAFVQLQWRKVHRVFVSGFIKRSDSDTCLTFAHKTFQEFCVARLIDLELSSSPGWRCDVSELSIGRKLLTADAGVLQFVAEQVRCDRRAVWEHLHAHSYHQFPSQAELKCRSNGVDAFCDGLVHLVLQARSDQAQLSLSRRIAAANAASALNVARVAFSDAELNGLQIGFSPEELKAQRSRYGVDLGGVIAHRTNLQRCDLRGASLLQAYVRRSNLRCAVLDKVLLGELPMLLGHADAVTSLVLSVYGRTLYSGSDDNTIKQWNVSSGSCERTLQGHTNYVSSLALSADGRSLYSGSWDDTIKQWDVSDGICVKTLKGHAGAVKRVLLSADGRTLYSGSGDKTIKQWNVSDGSCLQTLKGHLDCVRDLVLSADGRTLYSGSSDNTIRQWSVSDGKCLRTFKGHTDRINSLVESADGRTLYSGSWDKTIKQWDVSDGNCVKTLHGHAGWVNSLVVVADGRTLYSGSRDKTIKQWNVFDGSCVKTLQGHTDCVSSLVLSDDGRTLHSGSADETIRQWNVSDGSCVKTVQGHTLPVNTLVLSADGRTLYSGSDDKIIKQWNVSDGTCVKTLQGQKDCVNSLALSADGRELYSGSWDNTIKQWNVNDGSCVKTLQGHTGTVFSLVVSADGRTLFSGSDDKTIKRWSVSDGSCVKTLQGHALAVKSLVLSADGRTLYSGSSDGTIKQWSLSDGSCVKTFHGHTHCVHSIVLSSDCRTLYSGSHDKTIKQWNLADGNCVKTLQGHTDCVRSLVLSADGTTMYSGSVDTTIRQWDVSDWSCVKILHGHAGWVTSLAVSDDGRTLYSGSDDSTIKQWNVSMGDSSIAKEPVDRNVVLWFGGPMTLRGGGLDFSGASCCASVSTLLHQLNGR